MLANMETILYVLLAVFGLGLLIVVHELGHLWMARRVGMRVEAFGIGVGKLLRSWHWREIRWELRIFPVGGYVRIAGAEKRGGAAQPDSYFSKTPWQRIQVALMGPIANFLFALILFAMIWMAGGRDEPFMQHTKIVGWVDPTSSFYQEGGRPGDEILRYGDRPYQGLRDLYVVGFLDLPTTEVAGERIDYYTGQQTPYQWNLKNQPLSANKGALRTVGVMAPASYLIYRQNSDKRGQHYPLAEPGPATQAGIQDGDQLIWMNGSFLFSWKELGTVLNAPQVLLSIQRDGEVLQVLVPRTRSRYLTLNRQQAAELEDWRFEAKLPMKLADLYSIPYSFNHEGVVEEPLVYLNEQLEESPHLPSGETNSPFQRVLKPGDRILAVSGATVHSAAETLAELQVPKALLVVRRTALPAINWEQADNDFIDGMAWEQIRPLIQSLGTLHPQRENGEYHLLAPIRPVSVDEMPLTPTMRQKREDQYEAWQQEMAQQEEGGGDLEERQRMVAKKMAEHRSLLKLGIPLSDRLVAYNPTPWQLFQAVVGETYFALKGLLSGSLSAKNMSGPVGIVQAMQAGIATGVKNGLYWLGFVSLSLGLVNLLPIPVLDGGHICLACWEAITGRALSERAMRRLMIPFIILLIGFLLFVTWHDLLRLFSS